MENIKILNKDYIAGLYHANGKFTISLIKGKNKIYIKPRLILTQDKVNIKILELIKLEFNNIGHIKIQNNNICKYTITNIKDIKNIIIPFFDKYKVRDNKYLGYLKYKLIVNILYNEKIIYKSSLWLFCLMLSIYINPLISISKQLRYLNIKEQYIIINKIIPNNINYNKLINLYCPELINIKDIFNNNINININNNILTKEFIWGLFDGNGNLNINLINNNSKYYLTIKFQIIQDIYNKNILNEILIYFNNKGIIKQYNKSIIYYNYNTIELYNIIIPKLLNLNNISNIDIDNISNIEGPYIKLYKIINYIKIYNILLNNSLNNIDILNKVLYIIYNTNNINKDNISFKKWKLEYLNKIERNKNIIN